MAKEILADFQNCHIWAWNLAIGQSSRSCTCTRFLPQGVKLELIFALRAVVSEMLANFQIAIFHVFRHEAWPLAKVPEVVHILFFYPRGSKLNLFSFYRQWFLRYGPIFKIAILGMMKLGQSPEVAHILSFYPRGSKVSLFSLYGQRFLRSWRYRTIFKIAIFGHDITWPLTKAPEVAHILSFYPRGLKLSVLAL